MFVCTSTHDSFGIVPDTAKDPTSNESDPPRDQRRDFSIDITPPLLLQIHDDVFDWAYQPVYLSLDDP